jgi:hypothetical protein
MLSLLLGLVSLLAMRRFRGTCLSLVTPITNSPPGRPPAYARRSVGSWAQEQKKEEVTEGA